MSAGLAPARRRIQRRFGSRVRVQSPGVPGWDEATESATAGTPTIHYDGPASVRTAGQAGRVVNAAGELMVVKGYLVDLPTDAAFPLSAHVVVTACRATPALVGAELFITEAPQDDAQLTRRVLCSLVSDT